MNGNTFAEGSMVKKFILDWDAKRYIVTTSKETKDAFELNEQPRRKQRGIGRISSCRT
jgi:hypothetical protein